MKIYIQQLREGKREKIDQNLSPEFLDIKEDEVVFKTPVQIEGEAYATDDHLILQFSACTNVEMPCSICNNRISIPIDAKDIYYTTPFDELKSLIFDFTELVREEIILRIPHFVECQGKCPKRSDKAALSHHHFPFADL